MAGETLVSADAMDKAMIVSLFIGLPPFSPLILKYTSEKTQKHCVLTVRDAGYGAQPDAPLSNNRTRHPLGRTRRIGSPPSPRPVGCRLDRGVCTRPQAVTNYFIFRNSIGIIIAIQ
ncbi:hypothetical protein [Ensifer adhaerens]|uniref:hypothetical protein n=1 Tax=Ensifer adhaerens TaxID=106592 RepID=UPI00159EBE8F|nr:hypothetical protein [Ensifer adhaerens]